MLNHTIYVDTLANIFTLFYGSFDNETLRQQWFYVSHSPFVFHNLKA